MNLEEVTRGRQRSKAPEYLQTLLNSLTVDQLRTALAFLDGEKRPSVRSRSEAEDAVVGCGKPAAAIEKALLDVEARSPVRHCVLAMHNGSFPQFIERDSLDQLTGERKRLVFRMVHQTQSEDIISSTFEHDVEVKEWRQTDDQTKKLDVNVLRHPIIFRQYKKSKIALFCFPGFSQGSGVKSSDRVPYSEIITALMRAIRVAYRIDFASLPVDKCIAALQSSNSTRVRIVRTDMEAAQGRVLLTSPGERKSVNTLLTDFIHPHLKGVDKNNLEAAISEAVIGADSSSVVAHWVDEQVTTRVTPWEFCTEFLFVWHKTNASFSAISRIMELVASVSEQLAEPRYKTVWDFITAMDSGQVTSIRNLRSKVNADEDEVKKIVLDAVNAGILTAVYRLRVTELLVDYPNEWTARPSKLRRMFKTVDGLEIDGRDPSIIDVAFQRNVMESIQ
jgi:hypothetical protein